MAKIEEKIIDDINIDNNFASKQINTDIIPYACYYNENTIITQNGELLSTIKIPSFIVNKSKESFYNLRKDLTNTCKKHSKISNNINFWFQTVRKPVNNGRLIFMKTIIGPFIGFILGLILVAVTKDIVLSLAAAIIAGVLLFLISSRKS